MSRDPTLLIDESNLTIGSDGRAYYTFKADGDTKSVKLANNKCIGTTRFNQLMIERGVSQLTTWRQWLLRAAVSQPDFLKTWKERSVS